MSEFSKGLPSIRKIQHYIKESQEVEIKLTTNDLLIGHLIWQDPDCICLVDHSQQPILIWLHSLVYIKAKA